MNATDFASMFTIFGPLIIIPFVWLVGALFINGDLP